MTEQPEKSLVLVVDDHVPAAEMLSRLFMTRGYESICAYSGQDAIEKARQLRPDLIMLDIMMPGLDGFQTLEHLRANPRTEHIPVIFITAKDEPEDIEHGLQMGADDYIPKPIEPRELMARARSKIEASRLREALRQRTTDLRALLRLSEALNNQLQVDELLDLILYLVLDLLPCKVAVILHKSESGILLETRQKQKQDYGIANIDSQSLQRYFSQNKNMLYWSSEDVDSFADSEYGLAVSLQHGEHLHGILVALSDRPLDDNHCQLFEAIGRQTTLALRNAELYAVKVKYAEQLEDMVEERTAELRSAQGLLVRAEKLASIGRLSAGIAHEINNPLMPIRVNLELMYEDLQEGRAVNPQDIEGALRSVNRISRIVERLQQFTRRRAEDAPAMQPVKIADVVADVLTLSRTFIRQGGINVETNLDDSAHVFGNRDQLEQVFLNLVLNARAAMSDGDTLYIDSVQEDEHLKIHFEDTGCGIPEKLLDKIFEPFISTKEDGSGLGLFISYGVIHDHNGRITVESKEGKGTKFTITLPTIQDAN